MSDYKQTRDAAGKVRAQYEKMLRNLDDDDLTSPLDDQRVKALVEAGKAVVDRWDSPLWKDLPHTGESIADLRAALSALEENK